MRNRAIDDQLTKYLADVHSIEVQALEQIAGAPPSRATSTRATALRRELDTYLDFYNYDRVHHGRLTRGQIPADTVYAPGPQSQPPGASVPCQGNETDRARIGV